MCSKVFLNFWSCGIKWHRPQNKKNLANKLWGYFHQKGFTFQQYITMLLLELRIRRRWEKKVIRSHLNHVKKCLQVLMAKLCSFWWTFKILYIIMVLTHRGLSHLDTKILWHVLFVLKEVYIYVVSVWICFVDSASFFGRKGN